jgi:hypothetical protein
MPSVLNRISRYRRRVGSVDSTLIESNRFLIVGALSSAASTPLPFDTIAEATVRSLSLSIHASFSFAFTASGIKSDTFTNNEQCSLIPDEDNSEDNDLKPAKNRR